MSDKTTTLDLDAIERRIRQCVEPCGCDGCSYPATHRCDADDCHAFRCADHADIHERATYHELAPLGPSVTPEALALVAEVRRLRTDNVNLDNATRGALDDLAKVRAELDVAHIRAEHDANAAAENAAMVATLARKLTDARAALRANLRCDECEELATRTHAETASFGCDAHGVGEGWSDTTHAAAVRTAVVR